MIEDEQGIGEILAEAMGLFEIGKFRESIRYWEKVLILDLSNATAWVMLGQAHEQLKNWNKAIGCYDHLLSVDPNHQDALWFKKQLSERLHIDEEDSSAQLDNLDNKQDPKLEKFEKYPKSEKNREIRKYPKSKKIRNRNKNVKAHNIELVLWFSDIILGICVGLAFVMPFFVLESTSYTSGFSYMPTFLILGGIQAFFLGLYGMKEVKNRAQKLLCLGFMTMVMGFIMLIAFPM